MKKISKTIQAIKAILKKPWLLNHILADDSVWNTPLQEKYNLKHGFPVVDLNQIQPNFSETLENFAFLGGGSLPTDIALLKVLSKKFEGCSYFEIGTWRGESVVNIADTAKECYTLNLSQEEMLSMGLNSKYAELHGFFSKKKKNVTHLIGNSLTFDYAGLNKKFDLIFIDGNHDFDFVKSDTTNIFKHLLHEKSIVVWHDYAYSPEKLRPEVILAILEGTPKEFHSNLYHVSNTMCAVFMKGDFKTSFFSTPIEPNKTFKVTIESGAI